jgi:tetratricopeptide (TPR) repeat protein
MGLLKKLFGGGEPHGDADAAVADMNEALWLYRKGQFQEALRIGDRLIEADPGIGLSWRFRGECLFSLARYADAVEAFEKAAAVGGKGTDDVFLWSALALHNAGQQAEAKARVQRALATKLSPELRGRAEEALRKLDTIA